MHMVAANNGSNGVPHCKEIIFSKVVPRPFGMLKEMFLARCWPVVTRLGAWEIPKCLETGPFSDPKWVKNRLKMDFSKRDL